MTAKPTYRASLGALSVCGVLLVGCPATMEAPDGGVRVDAPARDTSVDSPRDTGIPDAPPDAPSAVCVPADCDDANPCTSDLCAAGTCNHLPMAGPCNDGIYCNGADSCDAGACTTHAGEPCTTAGTRCDETVDACVGCITAADCPGGGLVAGTCAFADLCDQNGTRTDTVYACTAGMCAPTMTEVACARDTEGTTCGETTRVVRGCTPIDASPCQTRGHTDHTITAYVCAGGACTPRISMPPEDCTIPTDGIACGGRPCSDWSICNSPPTRTRCFGMRSRRCDVGVCGGGLCIGSTRFESEECPFREGEFCYPDPLPCSAGLACVPNTTGAVCQDEAGGVPVGCMVVCGGGIGACTAGRCARTGTSPLACSGCPCP